MYNWRKMSNEARVELLELRNLKKQPCHSLPHYKNNAGTFRNFHLVATCYEHHHFIGKNGKRLSNLQSYVLKTLLPHVKSIYAWAILTNHYHILIRTDKVLDATKALHQLHGNLSRTWNAEDDQKGRKIWCNVHDRKIKNQRHFFASLNYIHNNPVKHRYVRKWTNWPFSSAKNYLESVGRQKALEIWDEYDCSRMGHGWDDT